MHATISRSAKNLLFLVCPLILLSVAGFSPAAFAAAITPDAVTSSNLDVWLAADQLNGVGQPLPTDGFQFATGDEWKDLSGNDNHAFAAGIDLNRRPTFSIDQMGLSGNPVVQFNPNDGNPDIFRLPEIFDSPDPTLFVVGKATTAGNQAFLVDYDGNGGNKRIILFSPKGQFQTSIRDTNGDEAKATFGGTTSHFIGSMGIALDTASPPGVTTLSRHISANGTILEKTVTEANYDSTTWTGGNNPEIGRNPSNNGAGLDGVVAELIVFEGPLSAADRAGVEAYLHEKYFSSTIFGYDFTGHDQSTSWDPDGGDPGITVNNVKLSDFTKTGVATSVGGIDVFNAKPWGLGATNGETVYDNLTGSVDLAKYYEFTIEPESGYNIDFEGITFETPNRGNGGPRTWVVRSSLDNFATNLSAIGGGNVSVEADNVFFITADTSKATVPSTISLADTLFQDVTSSVTFRVYAFNAESTGSGWTVDNVTIIGTLAVPEPSTLVLVVLALLGLVFVRNRRATLRVVGFR